MNILKSGSKFITVTVFGLFLTVILTVILHLCFSKMVGPENSLIISVGVAFLVYLVFFVVCLLKENKA